MTTEADRETDIKDAYQRVLRAQFAHDDAHKASAAAQAAESAAHNELSAAKIEYSRLRGHPLAGKRVERMTGTRLAPRKIRGTVTLYDGLYPGYSLRNHTPQPGEWIILRDSGKTAYTLQNNAFERHEWRLCDDQ